MHVYHTELTRRDVIKVAGTAAIGLSTVTLADRTSNAQATTANELSEAMKRADELLAI
jgi:hypothetical protein